MKIGRILVAFVLAAAQGCAVAPLSNHVTARTNGEGGSLLSAGSTIGVGDSGWLPSLKYSIGLSDDFDLGFQYEVIEYGAWAKYALINNKEEGFSLAALGGTGLSFEGYYFYGGPVVSYKMDWFEPYFISRFNYVKFPQPKISIATIGEFSVAPGTYRYFQHTLGFMAWPLQWLGLGLEASVFGIVKSPFILREKDRLLLSGNFSFRF
jgi:hypothetical protein